MVCSIVLSDSVSNRFLLFIIKIVNLIIIGIYHTSAIIKIRLQIIGAGDLKINFIKEEVQWVI